MKDVQISRWLILYIYDNGNNDSRHVCQCADNKMNYTNADQSFQLVQELVCRAIARKELNKTV